MTGEEHSIGPDAGTAWVKCTSSSSQVSHFQKRNPFVWTVIQTDPALCKTVLFSVLLLCGIINRD